VTPLIIALDTTGPILKVAVVTFGGVVLAERNEEAPLGHAERVLEILGRTLADAGARLESARLIVAGLGPGSYTGTRVGAATALGLARGLRVPAAGVPTLAAVVAEAGGGERDGGVPTPRGGWYVGRYRVDSIGWQEVRPPERVEDLPPGAAGPAFTPASLARLGALRRHPVQPIYC